MRRLVRSCVTVLVTVVLWSMTDAIAFGQASGRTWVFFTDRDRAGLAGATPQELGISERALWRRSKVLPKDRLLDERDLPVAQQRVAELEARGIRVYGVSRWLNAASVEMSSAQAQSLLSLPYVMAIKPVRTLTRERPEVSIPAARQIPLHKTSTLDYGPSLTQLETTDIPPLHAAGIIGGGVIVGVGDDGFNDHQTQPSLRNIHVVAEYDFVQGDSNTSRAPGEYATQGKHGAGVLSSIAGFDNGNLIGGAYGVSVILAKTEIDSVEIHAEEDNYVMALEWMERLGADIFSTSLAYRDFDTTTYSYTYQNLDGKTTLVARAAGVAAQKGVLLVTAMGNEGFCTRDSTGATLYIRGTLWSPADADSILSVGAASSDRELACFSGTGPTSDGRIKPEVVAQGLGVYWYYPGLKDEYGYVNGTSAATPLVASAAALVLSAHPYLTPMQVREALMATALEVKGWTPQTEIYPNNLYGAGMIDATKAALYNGMCFSNVPMVEDLGDSLVVSTYVLSSEVVPSDSVAIHYQLSPLGAFISKVMAPTSTEDLYTVGIPKTTDSSFPRGYFTAYDSQDGRRASPWNGPDSMFQFQHLATTIPPVNEPPEEFTLLQNYPNPFNSGTQIAFEAPASETVELVIYNLLGQRVATVYRGLSVAGQVNVHFWNGVDDGGRRVASGMYIYQLRTPRGFESRKLLLLK